MSDAPGAKDIFADAIELDQLEREAFITRACAGDAALLREVRELIATHESARNFLKTPTIGPGPVSHGPVEGPGTVIGRYRLLEKIGEGGFGAVFSAEQHEPVARIVALKILKPGMDTGQIIARFEAERQALAVMDHPNIAKVLDAGATALGRPFFVMELVSGEMITTFSDTHRLTIRQRLELFGQVCLAVQHAHTKGVMHRDIKPSNVLVSLVDGRPQARVIDFGIAKATDQRTLQRTAFTGSGQLLGTPEYMSPEQAAGELDIDTRTDVYSLGVLLYELLTGTTPFDARRLRSAAFAELLRVIREVEPPKPSTRLSSLDQLPSIAAQRKVEPARLGRSVQGDLDWIVMKAIEKDRSRRYETASGLAADISRFLTGEAVLAAPPGSAYRLRKFVRRNRVPVIAGSLVALALVLGIAGTSTGMVWARREQGKAKTAAASEATQRGIAEAAAKEALQQKAAAEAFASAEKARADELKRVSDFQADMLAQVNPSQAGKLLTQDVLNRFEDAIKSAGVPEADRPAQSQAFKAMWSRINATDAARELIGRTILRPAAETIEKQFSDQPVVAAYLRQVVAERYQDLGLFDPAMPLQESALQTRRRTLGEDHRDTIYSIGKMSSLLRARGKLKESEPFAREAFEKSRRILGESDPDTLMFTIDLGYLCRQQGKLEDAERLYRDGLAGYRKTLGSEHQHTLTAINNLGTLLQARGKLDQAEPLLREALDTRRRVLGEEDPDTLQSINNLGFLYQAQGRLAEAEPLRVEAMEKCRKVLGESHPNTLKTISTMGLLMTSMGRPADAERFHREALDKRRRVLGNEHLDTITSIQNLASTLQDLGNLADAEPLRAEALETTRRIFGDKHPQTLSAINGMGFLLVAQERLDKAEPLYREALEKRRATLGDNHADTLTSVNNLGYLLLSQGKPADAAPLLNEALEKRRATLGDSHPDTIGSVMNVANLLTSSGKFSEAESLLLPAAAIAQAKLAPTNLTRLGVARAAAKLYESWHAAEPGKGFDQKAADWLAKLKPAAK